MTTVVKDKGWNNIKANLKKLDGSYTKVGVQQGAVHVDDGKTSDMVTIAAANEFGTKDIPSRPFMRQTFDSQTGKLSILKSKLFTKISLGTTTPKEALSTLGEYFTGQTKKTIRDLKTPPNAPSTIKRKKSANPLIDKGQLVQSISHVEVMR